MNNDLKPYLSEFSQFSQTGLYAYLIDRRKENTNRRIDELLKASLESEDALVRAIATTILEEAAVWQFFRELELALQEKTGREGVLVVEKQDRDYEVPEFASDFVPSYTP